MTPVPVPGAHGECAGAPRPSSAAHGVRAALDRRGFLGASAAALAGCRALGSELRFGAGPGEPEPAWPREELLATGPDGIDLHLDLRPIRVDGRRTSAIVVNGTTPGPLIRMREGGEVLIRVHNHLPESTSIHWHGVLLPFDMDGVPGISFDGIAPGETFTYRYPVKQSGTYWYHSHTGLQEQLGLHGPLVLEPAASDPVEHDLELPVVLTDWTFEDPHAVLRNLTTIEGYYNFQRPTLANLDDQARATGKTLWQVLADRWRWRRMRMDPTDLLDVTGVTYTYCVNGRSPAENWTGVVQPGQRVRLRVVNASAMTFFDLRIPGLPLTVVGADGQNVRPVETDELRIGVAETYDLLVTLPEEGAWTLFAEAMDRSGHARGTLATRAGLEAPVPARRRRPMLTMEDMGMVMAGGGHAMGHGAASAPAEDVSDGSAHHRPRVEVDDPRGPGGAELPTEDLVERVEHGPDHHGPESITMARTAYRQLDDPGVGLGADGWRVLTYGQLRCLETPVDRRPPTREFDLHLTGNMHQYIWGFDGKKWSDSDMIRLAYGERVRIHMVNDTMMSHPIHLHGMWMDLYAGGQYHENPRKHTVRVQPAELLTVDVTVDAPGQWAFHCHLLYHMELGMFRTVAVVRSLEGGPIRATS